MKRVIVKLNRGGVVALLRSPAIQGELRRRGQRIADKAGPGHEIIEHVGANRARVIVKTETNEAKWREAKHRNLTFAINAGRG